jgi:signal transduction histidine kinase
MASSALAASRFSVRRWVLLDALALLATGVVSSVALSGAESVPRPRLSVPPGAGVPYWLTALIAVGVVAGAAARRLLPPAVLSIIAVAAAAIIGNGPFALPLFAALFLMYLVPARLPTRPALVVLVVAATLALGGIPFTAGTRYGTGWIAVPTLLLILAWAVGYGVDRQRRYAVALHAEAVRTANDQVVAARQAQSDERIAIAREIHDVVAHTLAVITVQAGVANHVAADHPGEAQRVLRSIEDTSRGALAEMRTLLGVLRKSDDAAATAATAPAPQLDDPEALRQSAAEAGVIVDVLVEGDRPAVPSGVGLAAYRIAQEAITNVIKHAHTSRCELRIGYTSDAVTVRVSDRGRGGSATPGGHGLTGMRERVAMYRGTFRAGQRDGGGFEVVAILPVSDAAA